MANLVSKLISNRYLVNSLIASGGMASVYLAQDQVLERTVALKVIHPHLAADKSFVDKFRREAKVAARLSHPNLVNVFDQGQDGEIIFLVMEYVPGITLRDALRDFGSLEASRALEIIEPLSAGLAAAHNAGILHRDLKPENVFLSDDGTVKLGDFGLARDISQNTQTGSVVGTVAYLSPELVTRGAADARSDIYSLGVMLFELLTGSQPFQGEQAVQIAYQHANDNVPAPSISNPAVPELLDEIVLWCTSRNPSHRPANAAALLPVIRRARVDIERGQTTSLGEIAKTMRIDLDSDSDAPLTQAFKTEVLSDISSQPVDDRSQYALKLERASRRSGRFLIVITLLVLFVSSGAGWWFSSGPGGLSLIPNLEGREESVAREILEPVGFNVAIKTESSGLIPTGKIIRSEPPFGNRVFKSSTITLFVSSGPKQVTVPDYAGLNLDQMRSSLAEASLQEGLVEYFFTDTPKDKVFNLTKPVGDQINQDSQVGIWVSLGPLPDVKGLSREEALNQLAGLEIEITEKEIFNNEIPAGTVISLVPSKQPLPEGGAVRLEISKGPEIVKVPNVVGETIAAAKNLLESLGFKVVIDTNQLSSNFGIAKVKKQNPGSGVELRYGDSVTIISR
ncbi:MAG: Stk1 family PASTA domain-containing Ser/Thr kinase [Actinomycetota bacterium]